ncbi:hypothetical protein WH52_03530 [Tenacibaculum holothuriorum]|uniref:DUF4252 domain-containing protein n=1 Tax=Tenacibaculum holothuriorum TaxID=1635173 RepID=A0A1Y2PGD0_9FLAO|nr:DUF4252 domain-containing protein [Tenacibaculum holothuriorum]OSY89061.1 hypothetical protein WH52_03530 [Tenacibaculum holothuriorum]
MKRILTALFCFFLLTITAQEAKFKQFYKNHKDKSAFSINLSSSFAGSFFDEEDNEEIKNLLKKSSDFKVMIFDNEDSSVSKDFNRFSRKNNLKTLVRAKEKGGKAEVLFIEKAGYVREIVVRASGKSDKMVLLGIKTKITKDELASLLASTKDKVASN